MDVFTIKSGHINITDPCYENGTWCGMFELAAKNGNWEAEVKRDSDGCIVYLRAYHAARPIYSQPDERLGEVGVDSGQMSIIDSDTYPKGDSTGDCGDFKNKQRVPVSFYDECCKRTLSEDCFGIVSEQGSGAVSSTGYGDGLYDVFVKKDGEEIVAVEIVFLNDEDNEDNEEEVA